jgi:hypothetical protein
VSSEDEHGHDEPPLQSITEIKVDTSHLYREEVFTDLRIATIRRLTPVRADGTPDPSRPALYSAQTTLMSQAGPLPVEAPIDATSLEDAAAKFPAAIQEAVDRLLDEAREIRRREASRIVVPSAMPPPPGGARGGGIIR